MSLETNRLVNVEAVDNSDDADDDDLEVMGIDYFVKLVAYSFDEWVLDETS